MSGFLQNFRPLVWFLGLLGFVPASDSKHEAYGRELAVDAAVEAHRRLDDAKALLRRCEETFEAIRARSSLSVIHAAADELLKMLRPPPPEEWSCIEDCPMNCSENPVTCTRCRRVLGCHCRPQPLWCPSCMDERRGAPEGPATEWVERRGPNGSPWEPL